MPLPKPFLLALADMARGFVALKFAELAREGELLLVRQRLLAKDEDGVPLHRRVDARACPRRERRSCNRCRRPLAANASGMGATTMGMGASLSHRPPTFIGSLSQPSAAER